ncbi:DUF498-domain-containing protein [Ramaria rubella]|nr:DUF498-domain-containing protein [Ramaria rubella]
MLLLALRPRISGFAAPRIHRTLHSSCPLRSGLTNMLADASAPAVQVKSITPVGHIELTSGLTLSGACIFLGGKVFLWDIPIPAVGSDRELWRGWGQEHFEIFDVVVPKPEILILGTGARTTQLPPLLRTYLRQVGLQADVMDTRNACSTFNLLAEEGRNVAAALLPLSQSAWQRIPSS